MSQDRKTQPGEPRPGIGRPIAVPGVQAPGDWSHKVPNGFIFLNMASLVNFSPDSHNVVVEQPAAGPREKQLSIR